MSSPIDKQPALPPDAAARAAALDLSRHIIAVAPAGSGKTGLLVQRLLAALATVETPEQVVAMTFTNKAAAEIRTRVLAALERAAQSDETPTDAHDRLSLDFASQVLARDAARAPSARWSLIDNPERLRATTIDGLQAQIAAELPLLSGLGGRPRVVDDPDALYEEATLSLFGEIEDAQAPPELIDAAAAWLRAYGNRVDRLIEPLADLLGRREQWQHTLAEDFDWRAADEIVLEAAHLAAQQRLNDCLPPDERAELLAILREASSFIEALAPYSTIERWPVEGYESASIFEALTVPLLTKGDKASLRKPAGLRGPEFPKGAPHTLRLRALLETHADDSELEAAALALRTLPPATMPEPLAQLREALRVLLRRLLGHLRRAMGERGETDFVGVAEAARAALRPRDSEGFGYGDALLRRDAQLRHLLVDEMQDTSESQLELLRNLTLGWADGDGRSLFLVGDPQQSIYSFRKAEVRLFQQLLRVRRLGELSLKPLRLSANFRSAPAVVDWFNDRFDAIFPARDDERSGEVAYSPSIAVRAAPADGMDARPAVQVHAFGKDEALQEARNAAVIAAGFAAAGGEVAILVRARSHVRATLAELRHLGVRAACQDVDPLAELPAVRDVLALARALWHPEDRLSWAILLRAPFVGMSWADLVALSTARSRRNWPDRLAAADDASALSAEGGARVARLLSALTRANGNPERNSLPERVETLWTALGGPACVDAVALGDVRRCFALLREHASNGLADGRAFDRAVGQLYAAGGDGAVQVMTIHKAKGLEFEHVLLVGAGRKGRAEDRPLLHFVETPQGPLLVPQPPRIWPDSPMKDAAKRLYDFAHGLHSRQRETEGLRLLYVAATRARQTLDISLCCGVDSKTGAKKPASRSFAAALLPGLAADGLIDHPPSETAAAMAELDDGSFPSPPRAPRLPLDFVMPIEPPVFQPREQRALRPSEAVLSASETKRQPEDEDVYAQLVGTMLHQALAKIAVDGVARWAGGGSVRAPALRAGFRRLGMPEPQVESAVARVVELIDRVLASDTGRWLLAPHAWARAEFALAGFRDGRWLSALLDRCFETDDGALWVVDYKAAARPVPADALDRYIADATQRYRPQLELYAGLLGSHRGTAVVRSALYFVEADRFVEL